MTMDIDLEQPNIEYIARVVNRKRQRLRPEDPKDLEFEINEEFFPDGFYQGDVKVAGRRHLIFPTDDRLRLLKTAKRWYLDSTFKERGMRQTDTTSVCINVWSKNE